MEAGVVTVHPGDDPDVEVVVAPELRVVAMLGVEVHELATTTLGSAAIPVTSGAERRQVEVAVEGQPQAHAATSASDEQAGGVADPQRHMRRPLPAPGSAAGTTGRSEP